MREQQAARTLMPTWKAPTVKWLNINMVSIVNRNNPPANKYASSFVVVLPGLKYPNSQPRSIGWNSRIPRSLTTWNKPRPIYSHRNVSAIAFSKLGFFLLDCFATFNCLSHCFCRLLPRYSEASVLRGLYRSSSVRSLWYPFLNKPTVHQNRITEIRLAFSLGLGLFNFLPVSMILCVFQAHQHNHPQCRKLAIR